MRLSIYSYPIGFDKTSANKEAEFSSKSEAAEFIEQRIAEVEDDETNNEPDMYFFCLDENGKEICLF